MSVEPSEYVRLPVGYEKDGVRYRNVVIDELSGVDEALMSNKKKTGGNQAKGLTLVLARAIQEIEGLVPRKSNPDTPIDPQIPRMMYQVDRDFLISRVQMLSDRDETVMRGTCTKCRATHEQEALISERPIKEWPDDQPLEMEFELKKGYAEIIKGQDPVYHTKGTLRLPRGRDQEAVAALSQDNPGQAMTAILAACIKNLGTLDHIDQTIAARLKGRDRRYLFNLIRDKAPGVKVWDFVTCYNCGNPEVEVILDLSGFFG